MILIITLALIGLVIGLYWVIDKSVRKTTDPLFRPLERRAQQSDAARRLAQERERNPWPHQPPKVGGHSEPSSAGAKPHSGERYCIRYGCSRRGRRTEDLTCANCGFPTEVIETYTGSLEVVEDAPVVPEPLHVAEPVMAQAPTGERFCIRYGCSRRGRRTEDLTCANCGFPTEVIETYTGSLEVVEDDARPQANTLGSSRDRLQATFRALERWGSEPWKPFWKQVGLPDAQRIANKYIPEYEDLRRAGFRVVEEMRAGANYGRNFNDSICAELLGFPASNRNYYKDIGSLRMSEDDYTDQHLNVFIACGVLSEYSNSASPNVRIFDEDCEYSREALVTLLVLRLRLVAIGKMPYP